MTTREPTHGTASGVVGAAAGARSAPWVLVAAIALVAANLRTPMASLPPLAEAVLGAETAIGAGLGLVLAGLVLRGSGGGAVWSLYAGTFVAGAGIALAGTLLPGLVKSVFPARRSGLGTGLTMAAMMGLAAVASATSVPLADALGGWSRSLLAWVPLAVLAAVAWMPVARAARRHPGR
ncbi:hypothetical protein [Ornithinibacter aureus]|uniref:hypothetical protein n=1 Tax=Ornithinibacter aureus TaxID=622664 RepID=UPI00135B6D63|nr:hypothetical protein [Ornithinibacter aureus]